MQRQMCSVCRSEGEPSIAKRKQHQNMTFPLPVNGRSLSFSICILEGGKDEHFEAVTSAATHNKMMNKAVNSKHVR